MAPKDKVVQFSQARKEKQSSLRREYERHLFDKFLGCYTVIEKYGLKGVELVDISQSGLSFRLPEGEGNFRLDEEFEFRFYFSSKTYLPIKVMVKRIDKVEDQGIYQQFGCTFDTSWSTYNTLVKFVEFIELFGLTAKEDKGESQIWML